MKSLVLATALTLFLTLHIAVVPVWAQTDPVEELREVVENLKTTVGDLARQTMLQQLFVEERIRSEGDSGVKIVRGRTNGPQNYYSATHIGGSFNAIHDHSNFDRTIGMGEIIAVMNGVEFRTRHNDYKLNMPLKSSSNFHDTQDLPFPEVPPAVTNKTTVEDQIDEMRLWFKAFKDQDYSERDYRDYFKPVLCYMEGAWTLDQNLEEPFDSDRHQIDASSWFELQELIRYASYTGTKSRLENIAYLPTTIMSVNQTTGLPQYAQWNYRILCHPIQEDIPVSYFKQMDDLSYRYPRGRELEDLALQRAARFQLDESSVQSFTKYTLLDRIFYTIPGKDNTPPADLREPSLGETLYDLGSSQNVELNTGYYHRWYRFGKAGAMGLTTVSRGFNDMNLWVAQTTQNRVAPIGYETCTKENIPGEGGSQDVCTTEYTRFSYAIPLEIIYLTPLLSWNPYDIEIHSRKRIAGADGRNGNSKPYNGTDFRLYYLTPVEFFQGATGGSNPADTVRNSVKVLDKNGVVRQTTASGTRIVLPDMKDVGQIRLRYPIAPVHGEGSSVWKELNALKDIIADTTIDTANGDEPTIVDFVMSPAKNDPPGEHIHKISISYDAYRGIVDNRDRVNVTSSTVLGHDHNLRIRYNFNQKRFEYFRCDDQVRCWDNHFREIFLETKNQFTLTGLPAK